MHPRIDPERCDGCGVCIYECGKYVLALDVETDQAFMRKGRTCVDCFLCEMACPCGAIEMKIGGLPRSREGRPH